MAGGQALSAKRLYELSGVGPGDAVALGRRVTEIWLISLSPTIPLIYFDGNQQDPGAMRMTVQQREAAHVGSSHATFSTSGRWRSPPATLNVEIPLLSAHEPLGFSRSHSELNPRQID